MSWIERKTSFTLPELLISLAALTMVVAIFLPVYVGSNRGARQVDAPKIGSSRYNYDGDQRHTFTHFQKRFDRIEEKIDSINMRLNELER